MGKEAGVEGPILLINWGVADVGFEMGSFFLKQSLCYGICSAYRIGDSVSTAI